MNNGSDCSQGTSLPPHLPDWDFREISRSHNLWKRCSVHLFVLNCFPFVLNDKRTQESWCKVNRELFEVGVPSLKSCYQPLSLHFREGD